jgi:hypothetical protein
MRSACAGLLVCALGLLACGEARAGFITFDPDGGGPAPAQQIAGLDFSVGNLLGKGLASATVGSTVEVLYQSTLAGVINTGGVTVAPPGLNGTPGAPAYEITAVSRYTAVVTGFSGGGGNVSLTLGLAPVQANPFVELWYDPTSNANNLAGTGFNNGTRILHGVTTSALANPAKTANPPPQTYDQFGANNYPGITTVTSLGSELTGVDLSNGGNGVDPTFFVTPVSDASFNTSMIAPFLEVDPSLQFAFNPNGGALIASAIGPVNGASGPDWQFQSDGNMTFTPVPEPASMGLIAISAIAAIRRQRKG